MTAFNMQTTGGPTITLVRERTGICDRSTHICEWGLSCTDTTATFGTAGCAQDCGGQVHNNLQPSHSQHLAESATLLFSELPLPACC